MEHDQKWHVPQGELLRDITGLCHCSFPSAVREEWHKFRLLLQPRSGNEEASWSKSAMAQSQDEWDRYLLPEAAELFEPACYAAIPSEYQHMQLLVPRRLKSKICNLAPRPYFKIPCFPEHGNFTPKLKSHFFKVKFSWPFSHSTTFLSSVERIRFEILIFFAWSFDCCLYYFLKN